MRSPAINAPTFTGAVIRQWFGRKPPPEAACDEIAAGLNNIRRACEPRPTIPTVADDEWLVWDQNARTWKAERYDADPWWNPQEVTARAKALLEDVPAMLWHWHRMRESLTDQEPARVRGGYDAIERVRVALGAAMSYIEFPFGEHEPREPRDHRKNMRLHDWHRPALAIRGVVTNALMTNSRQSAPGFSRDAAATRVVCNALSRLGYRVSRADGEDSETNTIARFFKRWEKHWRKQGT